MMEKEKENKIEIMLCYNTDTVKRTSIGKPTVNFGKAGAINFSKSATNKLGLKKGSKVEFLYAKGGSIYIAIDTENGFELRSKDNLSTCFNSSNLSTTVQAKLSKNKDKRTFKINTTPINHEEYGKLFYVIPDKNH